MTDCAHWIPVMLEQETAEHKEAESELYRKSTEMKRAIDDIRAIINNAEANLPKPAPTMKIGDPFGPPPWPSFTDIFGGIFR